MKVDILPTKSNKCTNSCWMNVGTFSGRAKMTFTFPNIQNPIANFRTFLMLPFVGRREEPQGLSQTAICNITDCVLGLFFDAHLFRQWEKKRYFVVGLCAPSNHFRSVRLITHSGWYQ